MAELGRCTLFEWGWPFLVIVAVAGVSLIVALIYLAKFFGLHRRTPTPDEANFDGFTIRGSLARFGFFIVLLGAIGYAVYYGYDRFHETYSVAFDTASGPSVSLETLRSKFQGDTQATIIIGDRAKKFSVTGHYEGACTLELFETICRQYASRLSCNASLKNQTLTVDAK
jgi:hypothetical protein